MPALWTIGHSTRSVGELVTLLGEHAIPRLLDVRTLSRSRHNLPTSPTYGSDSMQYLHTMIRVSDLEQSLDFFCRKLGFVELSRSEHEKGRYTLVFLAAPGDSEAARQHKAPLVELTFNWDERQYAGGCKFGHLAYQAEDIYALCEHLMKAGVVINRPPRDGHMAFIKTPDGISIELLQEGASLPLKEPWISMPNTGTW